MRPTPKQLLLLIAIAVIGASFFVAQSLTSGAPGSVETRGSSITAVLGTAEGGGEVVVPVRLLEGADAAHESTHMFETIEGMPGLGRATLDTETLELTVTYDPAVIDPSAIRSALARSGYAPLAAEDLTPTELAEDGSVQRLAIADEGGFSPAFISARAGVPIELDFAPGQECRTSIVWPELELTFDISQGAVVSLPALEPGTYRIVCGGGADEGALIVE